MTFLFMPFCIIAHMQKKKKYYEPFTPTHPLVHMFVLFNHETDLNRIWKNGSLWSWDCVVLALSQNSPPCLVASVNGSIALVPRVRFLPSPFYFLPIVILKITVENFVLLPICLLLRSYSGNNSWSDFFDPYSFLSSQRRMMYISPLCASPFFCTYANKRIDYSR